MWCQRRGSVTIEVVEIGDAWVLPAWGRRKVLPRQEVERFLARRDAMDALFQRFDDWWANQPLGRVVHYCGGFGRYVRGVVVEHEGKRQMRATALVGDWHPAFDLPKRKPDGTVDYGYHGRKVLDGDVRQPNPSVMWEGSYSRRGEGDPTQMEPINLSVPDITEAESNLARLVNLRDQVLRALEYTRERADFDLNDPAQHAEAVGDALARAKHMLRGIG